MSSRFLIMILFGIGIGFILASLERLNEIKHQISSFSKRKSSQTTTQSLNTFKQCPYCFESIKKQSKFCEYCKHNISYVPDDVPVFPSTEDLIIDK